MEVKKQPGRRNKNRASKTQHSINTVAHPDAAGIDIGAEELVVAVPHDRDAQSVRTFSTFTSGVLAMRDWLVSCKINTVAVESTGNYWIATYDILEQAGIDVCLVNARHVKGVPGKKTDVCDAQWLQQLHAAGLLKKSFRPAQDIVPLRYLMRHRASLIEDSSRLIQLMQKVLTEMNLKIQHVFSDIDGVSAQAIITAIVAGERDAKTLAGLRDPRCRSSEQTIMEALGGNYRMEYIFVLQQSQNLWKQQLEAIATCDEQIEELIAKIYTPSRPQSTPPATGAKSKARPQKGKNAPGYDVIAEAKRFYGVDLSEIDGVSSGLLSVLMSEVGTAEQLKAAFCTSERFCSWIGVCPDNRISGGKVLKAKTRSIKSRLAGALRLSAFGLGNAKSKLGEYCRRMKGRLGKAEGITATAHKIARIIYAMITNQQGYDDEIAFKITPRNRERQLLRIQKQAAQFGFKIVALT